MSSPFARNLLADPLAGAVKRHPAGDGGIFDQICKLGPIGTL